LRSNLEQEKLTRTITASRQTELEALENKKQRCQTLEAELQQYGACNPDQVEEKRRAIVLAREAAFRWTDNYTITVSHFAKQYNISTSEIRKHFNLDDQFEDIN